MSRVLYALGAAWFALGVAGAACAHHSYAMFEMTKSLTLTGTVVEWAWRNPHVHLEMVAAGPGGPQHWEIETGSPSIISRGGMTRTSLRAGNKVTVKIHPLRDGTNGGQLMTVELPNGTTYTAGNPRAAAPADPNSPS